MLNCGDQMGELTDGQREELDRDLADIREAIKVLRANRDLPARKRLLQLSNLIRDLRET
jgi:hypothetical protein